MSRQMTDEEREALDLHVAKIYNTGQTLRAVAETLDIPLNRVRESVARSKIRGTVPWLRESKDAEQRARRLADSGGISRVGALRDVISTLTVKQVDYLLHAAPRATTLAQAIAIFLATHLPEE